MVYKKILVLDYYIGGFVKIIRNAENFDKWFFVDTHCGTGLIGFKDYNLSKEKFPGSPLIAAFRNEQTPFTDYFFSDSNYNSISVLDSRLQNLKALVGTHNYKPVVRSFKETVKFVENHNQFGTAFLIFIDPTGFSDIHWDLMKRLLSISTADIFFTFMTYSIALNRQSAKTGKATATMTSFFGNDAWKNLDNGDELLEQYIKQIREFKKYVFHIPVHPTGKRRLYDLIIATNSKGANNIITDAEKIMNITSTQMMKDALCVIAGKQSDLSQFS